MSRPKCTKCNKNFAKPGEETCRTCVRVTPTRAYERPDAKGNPNPKCSFVYDSNKKCQKYSIKDSAGMFGKPFCLRHLPDQMEAARRRKDKELAKVLPDERMRKLVTGEIPVEELDDEELIRGHLRNSSGNFYGKPPSVVPKVLYDKMISEIYRRADERLQKSLLDVVEMFVAIMQSPKIEPKDRLKAGMWIFERVRGKVPDNVHVSSDKPFQQIIEKIFAGPRAEIMGANALDDYVDAEIVEEDEED